ncbi:trans-acting enoyl reductase family protein [Streptomyces parvulus]|uniref:Saccharopine dehydrogenase n=1 Tax=Streptomyces parvulus TaxID=146923 RepID=A0A369V3L2_9ACTN|nr:saccharopine dehydrogenase NADP-binding domain-containing protein [Streptomyces parvulus]RDD85139.1 saccharopine dehydrogenase [Streptomyces parvulus]
MSREFDLIVFGATGFTGRRAVRYLHDHAPDSLRWAVAGRDRARLEEVADGRPAIVADALLPSGPAEIAARTRVVLNLAGPFRRYGDPLVAACVERGTHYCDISGETARVRDLIDRYHAAAVRAGVKIVPFGGVSSTPADIAALLVSDRLGRQPHHLRATVRMRGGTLNGGTVASMIDAVENGDAAREKDPFLLGPAGRAPSGHEVDPRGLRYDARSKAWLLPSPVGTSDTRAVRRSADILGRRVLVQEHLAFDGWTGLAPALAMAAGIGTVNALLRFRRGRHLLARLVPPGRGPSERQIAQGAFALHMQGTDADGDEVTVRVRGDGDPGNRITVTCGCEIALALVGNCGSLPQDAGVLTPATAIGSGLAGRLGRAGILFD